MNKASHLAGSSSLPFPGPPQGPPPALLLCFPHRPKDSLPLPLQTLAEVGVSLPQVQGGSHTISYHQPYQQITAGLGGLPSISPLPAARHTPRAEGLALEPCRTGAEVVAGGLNRPGKEQALTQEAGDTLLALEPEL